MQTIIFNRILFVFKPVSILGMNELFGGGWRTTSIWAKLDANSAWKQDPQLNGDTYIFVVILNHHDRLQNENHGLERGSF